MWPHALRYLLKPVCACSAGVIGSLVALLDVQRSLQSERRRGHKWLCPWNSLNKGLLSEAGSICKGSAECPDNLPLLQAGSSDS